MGYTGLLSLSLNSKVIPDLAFFDLLLDKKNSAVVIAILILAMSLTLSTIDTLINAISSLIIIDGNFVNKYLKGKEVNNILQRKAAEQDLGFIDNNNLSMPSRDG